MGDGISVNTCRQFGHNVGLTGNERLNKRIICELGERKKGGRDAHQEGDGRMGWRHTIHEGE